MKRIRKKTKKALAMGLACVMTVMGMVSSGIGLFKGERGDSRIVFAAEGTNVVSDGGVGISTADAVKIASLHNPISDEINKTIDYSYVYFGEYPQSEVTGSALTAAIIQAEYDEDGDAVVDDKKYYRQLAGYTMVGKEEYRYFIYEPVKWRVICKQNQEVLLRSDLVLDCQAYDSGVVNEKWEDASLREWLNSTTYFDKGFLKWAFTDGELNAIIGKDYYEGYGAEKIKDKIHLLSEVQLEEMGGLDKPFELVTKASDYAKAKRVKYKVENDMSCWWIRNRAGRNSDDMAGYVNEEGICFDEFANQETTRQAVEKDRRDIGVCPAIVLNLEETDMWCTEEEMRDGFQVNRKEGEPYTEFGYLRDNIYFYVNGKTLYLCGNGSLLENSLFDYAVIQREERIEEIVIAGSIKTIAAHSFENMKQTKKVTIAEGITKVGDGAFKGCENLEEVIVPTSLTDIGQEVFDGTAWLNNMQKKCQLLIINNILVDLNGAYGVFTIPSNVKKINNGVLDDANGFLKLTIPATVEIMEEDSFSRYDFIGSIRKFCVEEGSVAEAYFKKHYGSGYSVVKHEDVSQKTSEDAASTESVVNDLYSIEEIVLKLKKDNQWQPFTEEKKVEHNEGLSETDLAKINSLHKPRIDATTHKSDYSYVYFGSYPQREVTGIALTENIINADYVSDEVVVDEERYCRIKEADGSYRYFIYEPIRWRVICKEKNEAILRSDLVLDSQVYSEKNTEWWVDTSLRSWLNGYDKENGGFLNKAFTSDEIKVINGKMHADNYQYGAYARDKVYLLSGPQLQEFGGFRNEILLQTHASAYAYAKGVMKDTSDEGYVSWWVRNQQSYTMNGIAGYVDADGIRHNANDDPYCTNSFRSAIPQNSKGIGVCPAIVLDLTNTTLWITQEEYMEGIKINRGENEPYVETGKCGENVYYSIVDDTMYVTGSGVMYDYAGESEYDDDEKAASPVQSRPGIRKVVVEEGVENIGRWMFCRAIDLEEVVLPESLKEIKDFAFYNCSKLQSINFPSQLETIGKNAFELCSCLKEVNLSNKITQIGSSAFSGCSNLENIEIPSTTTTLGNAVLAGTKWMENERKKNTYVIINGHLFDMSACTGEAIIPAEVKRIMNYPIDNLEHISKIVIPSTVEKIDSYAFSNYKFGKESWKFYVEEGSAAEQYFKSYKWSGYYVIKKNGEVQQVVKEKPITSPTPIPTMSPKPSETVVTKESVIIGDVDRDGVISLSDAQKILKYALKIDNSTDEERLLADANENMNVELEDAQIILKVALKILPWDKTIFIEDDTKNNLTANEDSEGNVNIQAVKTSLLDTWEPFLKYIKDTDFYIEPPAPMKPVIYLYPEETTEIEVELDFNGDFTFTWPDYRDGWKVIAEPDGKLTDTYDGSEHYYLFWEGKSNVDYTFTEGFCVKGEDTAAFLKEALEAQGLTPKEYNDFITFWVPRMQENEYNVISFVEDVYTDNAKLSFSQEPDTMKRVFMAYYGSNEPVEIEEQELTGFERNGFTVVEWGGAEVTASSYIR